MSECPANHRPVIFGVQIRLGRLALGWSQQQLADEARVGVATIHRAERADRPPLTASNLFALQRALEAAGIEFIEDDERPGLRIRRQALNQERTRK